jgi:hypothetical protein
VHRHAIRRKAVAAIAGLALAGGLVISVGPGVSEAQAVVGSAQAKQFPGALHGNSVYTTMPQDPGAVVLGSDAFPVAGDGTTDDTAVIQAAIDEASRRGGENWLGNIVAPARGLDVGDGGGVVFVPEGRYLVSKRIDLHAGVRLVGFGEQRPEFFVAPGTAAFQGGDESFLFVATRRPVGFSGDVSFGNNDTFGTSLVNVNVTVADGNPAAVGIRFSGAQLFMLQDVDFDMGDGLAAIHHNANLIQRVNVTGGRVGMLAWAATPGWQTTIMDSSFTGQREAAIRTNTDAKLSVLRTTISDTSSGIEATPGFTQRVYVQDSLFRNISGSAITLNDGEAIPDVAIDPELNRAQNQVNVVDTGLVETGALLTTVPSQRTWAVPSPSALVRDATLGLRVSDALGKGESRSDGVHVDAIPKGLGALTAQLAGDVPLPPDSAKWVSIVDFAEGRSQTVGKGSDDTAIFQAALDAHDSVFVPIGEYLLSDTLELRAQNNLIGLNPRQTWLKLVDEAPAFADSEKPRGMIHTPLNGKNVVSGIGLDTNRWNPGSAQVRWQSGPHSMLSDVTTQFVKWSPEESDAENPGTGDPGYAYRGSSKYNFWVDGGGGSFVNLWSAYGWADNGFFAENTDVPATLYEVSVEHHRYREVVLTGVTGWEVHALQTEDHIYGWESQAVEIVDSHDVLLGNTVFFRVATVLGPHPYAVSVHNSTDIVIRGTRGYRDLNVENTRWGATIHDVASGREVAELEIAYLGVATNNPAPRGGLSLEPADTVFGTTPGESVATSIAVTNGGSQPLRDVAVDIAVEKGLAVTAQAPRVIAAGATVNVPMSVSVAPDAQLGAELGMQLRLVGTAGGGSYSVPLEMAVFVGGQNLAVGAAVIASSTLSNNVAANAVDGSTAGSRWISASADRRPVLTIDMGEPAELDRVMLYSGIAGSSSLRVVGVEVDGLIGDTWTRIGALEQNTLSPATIPVDAADPVSQVRLTFTQGSPTDALARVFEVQIYGIR